MKLRPCPFCGSEDVVLTENDRGQKCVSCNSCKCDGPPPNGDWPLTLGDVHEKEEAIKLWNTRNGVQK